MSRDPAQRIADALKAIERCQRYAAALDRDANDVEMAEDAIEAQPADYRRSREPSPRGDHRCAPGDPWPQIRGFRNILVRQYFGVDVEIVRDVVQGHLPRLAEALRIHAAAG